MTVTLNNEVKTFHVPFDDGTEWKVFEIFNGFILPCSQGAGGCMRYESSPSAVGGW